MQPRTNDLLIFFVVCTLLSGCTHNNVKSAWQQQVIRGELPDPSLIEVNGTYYASGSSNDWGPLYPIYKSTDLVNWSFVTFTFQEPPVWTISSFWAPELFFHNGTFYCYYTARRKDGVSCIGVATTENIDQGFKDRGQLLEWGNEAIDPFVFKDNDALFMTWKAYGLTPGRSIQIMGSELTADGLSLKGAPFEVLTADKDSWESGGMEGQCIVKHGDYLYMLYSGNACCGERCNYQVGVARARTMKGPWEKYEKNPILKGNDTWMCPGHGTALQTNEKWVYLYHAYPKKGFPYLGRTALLSEMLWSETTGWPHFDTDSLSAVSDVLKKDVVDNFDSAGLQMWWRHDIPDYTFHTFIDSGKLTLTELERKNKIGAVIAVNPDDADFTMTTLISERNNALKGLVLYATGINALGLGVKGDTLILWKVKDGSFSELNKIRVDYTNGIFLKASVRDAHAGEFYFGTDGKSWNQIPDAAENSPVVKGDNLAWWSWGIKAGLFVKGDSVSGEHAAVFDKFSIEFQ